MSPDKQQEAQMFAEAAPRLQSYGALDQADKTNPVETTRETSKASLKNERSI